MWSPSGGESTEGDKEGPSGASEGKLPEASTVVTTVFVDQNVRENMAGTADPENS